MPLQNMPDIVIASLCLHNLCILENDDFGQEVLKKSYKEKQTWHYVEYIKGIYLCH